MMNILDRLKQKPFPQCMACKRPQRAHGLFTRDMAVKERLEGDQILDKKERWIHFRKKIPTGDGGIKLEDSSFPMVTYTVRRPLLLCSEHGFSLSGTRLLRSLSDNSHKPKQALPEVEIRPGLTMSAAITELQRKTGKSVAEILKMIKPKV